MLMQALDETSKVLFAFPLCLGTERLNALDGPCELRSLVPVIGVTVVTPVVVASVDVAGSSVARCCCIWGGSLRILHLVV